jgi:hypothetical protein
VFEEVGVTATKVSGGGASGDLSCGSLVSADDRTPPGVHGDPGGRRRVGTTLQLRAPHRRGSLGVSAEFVAANVLRISIVASDVFNIEPITVTGLGIGASPEAALGPITAVMGDFTGAFAAGVASETLPSPGTVVAANSAPGVARPDGIGLGRAVRTRGRDRRYAARSAGAVETARLRPVSTPHRGAAGRPSAGSKIGS